MSELTFEQMLEESFKTIRNGEVVDGTVIDVKPDEIILNIGYKADGILSLIHIQMCIRDSHGTVTYLPMLRVTTYWGAEHIGISASDYEELTGTELNLKNREIAVGIEDREYKKEKKVCGEEYVNNYTWLYIGKYIPERCV